MFFRVARYYLRSEWIKPVAVVFAVALCAFFMVNNTKTMPMTYKAFASQYGNTLSMDKLAKKVNIPREELGDSLQEAYPVIHEQHFTRLLGDIISVICYFAPVFAGALALILLGIFFRKRRLSPLLAAGYSRGVVYIFLTILYFGVFLLVWVIIVPCCMSRYHLSLSAEQRSCLHLLQPTLASALFFSAAVAFFFTFLLRSSIPALFVSVGVLILLQWISRFVPAPLRFLISLMEWKPAAGPLIAQGCITAVTMAAAVVGGWLCFRRWEQA